MSTFIRRARKTPPVTRRPPPPRSAVARALADSNAATDAELLSALRAHPTFPAIVGMIDARISIAERDVRTLDSIAAGVNSAEAYERLRKERDRLCALTLLRATISPMRLEESPVQRKGGA